VNRTASANLTCRRLRRRLILWPTRISSLILARTKRKPS
jgi:hypothetical protein